MVNRNDTVKMARPGEADAVRTTIVGGRPPGGGANVGDVPRGLEVLIKKAAVDPTFKKLLLEKRAGAAEAIALKLEAAEATMLNAVPAKQLEAIIANTKVSPSLRPAFLDYAAGVMLAALGTATACGGVDVSPDVTRGIEPDIPPVVLDPAGTAGTSETSYNAEIPSAVEHSATAEENGSITGIVRDQKNNTVTGALIAVEGTDIKVKTKNNGVFVLDFVPAGKHNLVVSLPGYPSYVKTSVRVLVIPGFDTKISVELNTSERRMYHTVKGILTDRPSTEDND
jgi:hypothetical protein